MKGQNFVRNLAIYKMTSLHSDIRSCCCIVLQEYCDGFFFPVLTLGPVSNPQVHMRSVLCTCKYLLLSCST